jgi:hypothetical protein
VTELIKLWELLNYLCGKRVVAIMPELIAKLEQFGELRLAVIAGQHQLDSHGIKVIVWASRNANLWFR